MKLTATADECKTRCLSKNWCRGIMWKDGKAWMKDDPIQHGACFLLEELVSQTTSIPEILSFERVHGAHGHSVDYKRPSFLVGAKALGNWFSGRRTKQKK